jgi:hypothetical protein
LTNFSNGKQTQESLESGFSETTFQETNTALMGFQSHTKKIKPSSSVYIVNFDIGSN